MVGRRSSNTGAPTPPAREGRARRRLISVVIGLVLMEAGLRVLLGNFGQSQILMRSDDPEVCLELQPGVELTYTGWRARVAPSRMRVNSYGARGPEFAFDKAPGTLRIAAMGDSFTFGQGVEEEQAFVQVAASVIPGDTEVLNFGVPGHGTPQSVALVKKKVLATHPDVVLVNVFANDLSPEESYCVYGKGGSPFAAWTLRNVYVARLGFFLASPILRPKVDPSAAAELGTPSERFRGAIGELVALGEKHDFLPAVVLLTDRAMFLQSPWCNGCEPAHDLVEGTGVHVIDLSPTWRKLQEDIAANYITGDDHFSVQGNATVGEVLGAALTDWEALRERARRVPAVP